MYIKQEYKTMLEGLEVFKTYMKFWNQMKKICQEPNESKFSKDDVVKISYLPDIEFVVYDVCCYEDVNVYMLSLVNNNAAKLIISEEYIIEIEDR